MAKTIYATFATDSAAERAAGALMDHGVPSENVTFIFPQGVAGSPALQVTHPAGASSEHTNRVEPRRGELEGAIPVPPADLRTLAPDTPTDVLATDRGHAIDMTRAQPHAASGITTTTGKDALKGAVEGAGIGVGVGLFLGLATLMIPGIGLVAGAGALAAGLTALTGAAGSVAGGLYGYLADQGMPATTAQRLSSHLETGGPLVSVVVDEPAHEGEILALLQKYGAASIEAF